MPAEGLTKWYEPLPAWTTETVVVVVCWSLKGATPGPQGKVLYTHLSPLRQERVGRAGALVCLVVRSNHRRSDHRS